MGIGNIMNSTKIFKYLVPKEILKKMICEEYEFSNKHSYSQEGEDLILFRYFGDKKEGCYVDVGAHHPKRFSNTYSFYLRGWRGVNIDANQSAIRSFDIVRPEDINIFQPISLKKEKLKYYIFNEPALNTFDGKRANEVQSDQRNKFEITNTIELVTKSLTEVLDNTKISKSISFLSIDVEGLDFQVLQSLDLKRYHPELILIESLDSNIEADINSEVTKYLKNFGYSFFYRTFFTSFYRNNSPEIL